MKVCIADILAPCEYNTNCTASGKECNTEKYNCYLYHEKKSLELFNLMQKFNRKNK